MRPTRGLGSARDSRRTGRRPPIWPCSRESLPRFTPATEVDGIVTVALVLASRRVGVTHYLALGSSDFPHAGRVAPFDARPSGRLACAPDSTGRSALHPRRARTTADLPASRARDGRQ